jgi:hypothetical protein
MNEAMSKGKAAAGPSAIDDPHGLGHNRAIGGWLHALSLLYWMLCLKICCLRRGSGMSRESGECSHEPYVGYRDKASKHHRRPGYSN